MHLTPELTVILGMAPRVDEQTEPYKWELLLQEWQNRFPRLLAMVWAGVIAKKSVRIETVD